MLFKRGLIAILAGVSTAPVLYAIHDVRRSVIQETHWSVTRAIEEGHYLPGPIGRNLITNTNFNRLHPSGHSQADSGARWAGLLRKFRRRLTAAFLSGTGTSDRMVERLCIAKLVSKKRMASG